MCARFYFIIIIYIYICIFIYLYVLGWRNARVHCFPHRLRQWYSSRETRCGVFLECGHIKLSGDRAQGNGRWRVSIRETRGQSVVYFFVGKTTAKKTKPMVSVRNLEIFIEWFFVHFGKNHLKFLKTPVVIHWSHRCVREYFWVSIFFFLHTLEERALPYRKTHWFIYRNIKTILIGSAENKYTNYNSCNVDIVVYVKMTINIRIE